MGRGGKGNSNRNFKKRDSYADNCSDDSDEDYVAEVGEDVSDADSEGLGNSLDGYASEESFGSYVEDEEEEEFTKVVRSKNNKGSRESWKPGAKTSRKRKRVSYKEEDDEDYVNDDDDDDEEFSLDEDDDYLDDDCLDDYEELNTKKKTNNRNLGKKSTQKSGTRQGRKKGRKSRESKKPLAKKRKTNRRLRKKERCEIDDEYEEDFIDDTSALQDRGSKNSSSRRRRNAVYTDSDFVPSESSDDEYTISEEEREQMREASKLCASLRCSSSVKKIQEDVGVCQQGKSLARKGKEKVKELKADAVKQVCGICLSEEDKRRLRGTLNCCSHYFCFTCIMEWSKVESRCPLCKQRFKTITKNSRPAMGVEPRNVVIPVPKRDQVYQPSEEEIRSFIDPYENVICTECHEGGEDGLMLLCDLCDSPAHTFCVGLGREVPDGDWYCDGCKPIALGCSSARALDPMPDQTTSNNIFSRSSPSGDPLEGLDSTLEPSPRPAFPQGFGNLSSPRFPGGDVQAASPVSGAGAATLTQRRQRFRHILNVFSRMNHMVNRNEGISEPIFGIDLLNPHGDPCSREVTVQNSRTQETGASQSVYYDERMEPNDNPSSSVRSGDLFPFRSSQIRKQSFQSPTIIASDRSVNLTLWPELPGVTSISGHDQFHQCNSRQGIASEVNLSPCRTREENQFCMLKEELQSTVKSHMKSLSQEAQLDPDSFVDILKSSTHTILAACGLEQKSEFQSMPPRSICTHGSRVIAGQTSILKGYCSSCFDSYVRDVVKTIMDRRLRRQWLSLGL